MTRLTGETDYGPATLAPEYSVRPAAERLAAMAEAAGIAVEHRIHDGGETIYLTGRASGVYIRISRDWGSTQTAAEAALAALTTALEH